MIANIPVSIGHLLDQITILSIKYFKIKDPAKTKNIAAEIAALTAVCVSVGVNFQDPLYSELYDVNYNLWEIEDDIREKEAAKEFDDEFIRLARSVYYLNDKRSDIKKRINKHYGSTIVEEKQYSQYEGGL
jgi:hypothetical protein